MELFWYYGWDCASGCIWDPAAVAEIKPRFADRMPERHTGSDFAIVSPINAEHPFANRAQN